MGELVTFHTSSASSIKPYLGVKDPTTWGYLGTTHDDRVSNTINYTRGVEVSNLRTRTLDGHVWKLGDIVHSTPVSVAKPPDNFHVIYSDESYQDYFNAFKDRETVVYVGANDGMLHAFTSWQYDETSQQYAKPSGADSSEQIGDELWAYIPQSLLPHLKWLPSPNYTHVYYVDLKPKVFDAKILPDDAHYTDTDTDDNWGTILLCGLNTGGKHIQAQGDFNSDSIDTEIRDFYPSYLCMDVTDPRNPKLLWERTYTDLEMTTSTPAIVRVGDKWFAVFGSGPSDYDGSSSKKGHVFVVDLKTGNPYGSGTNDWLFETGESNAFMNSPVSIDKDLNFNVDALYFGESYLQGGTWKGKLYKVTVPWADASGNYDGSDLSNYSDNPLDTTNPWLFSSLFDATRPITTSVTLSKDAFGNVWIYGGTGRYLSSDDKVNEDTQYIFGLKDPFYNKLHTPGGYYADDYHHNYSSALELDMSDLLNSDNYVVTSSGEVFESGTSMGTWNDLVALAWTKEGWVKSLTITKERVLNKPSILGGIVFTPSFVPNDDICSSGGESYLYGVYYETGTAYYEPVFSQGTTTVTLSGKSETQVIDRISLGAGKASSLGIHVGQGKEATGFVQQSTGNVLTEALNPALTVKSGLRSWQEK
jgi:type IV pilus assembly protein PilY1